MFEDICAVLYILMEAIVQICVILLLINVLAASIKNTKHFNTLFTSITNKTKSDYRLVGANFEYATYLYLQTS